MCALALGATPVFVDICPDTLNLDASQIEDAITARSRVIAPVHYAGVGCDMERIMAIAERHDLLVVEDAAQAVNAHYNGRSLGSIGHFGCLSFHETKNYICGEGGALAINDERFIERACTIRDKGTNRRAFLRGEVDKYTWVSEGSSYVPSELCSAFLWGQLEQLNGIATRRHAIYQYYRQALKPLEARDLLQLPFTPEDCSSNYHMFYILLPTSHIRDTLLQHLRGCDIHSVIHFVPLHTSPMGRNYVQHSSLPVTDNVSDRLLRLPFFHSISEQEQTRVVHEVSSFLQSIAVLESKDLPVSQRADAF